MAEEKYEGFKITDSDKVDAFDNFMKQNYDKCLMDPIDYKFNERVFNNWMECLKSRYVTNLEETKKLTETKFLNEDNKQLSSITEQDGKNILDFAHVIRATLMRISFQQLLDQTKKISDELINYLTNDYQEHRIVVIIDNHLYSSNTWYTMLVMKPLFDDKRIRPRIINIIDKISQFQEGYNIPDSKTPLSEVIEFNKGVRNKFLQYRNTFFIHADDMSYSGQQLLGHIPMGLKYLFRENGPEMNLFQGLTAAQYASDIFINQLIGYTNNRYYIAIPYIGSQAINTYFPQLDTTIGGFLKYPFRNASIFMFPTTITLNVLSLSHRIFSMLGNERNISIHNTLSKPYFRKLFRYFPGSLPIFFDHKLADAISTLTYLISYSTCSTIDESDLIIGHMVTSCKTPPIKEIFDEKENKLRSSRIVDFIDESSRCPGSFYKTLNYTYRGIPLANKNASSMTTKYYVGRALNKAPFI